MKKIYFFLFSLLLLVGCDEKYTFNENFTAPDTFSGPEAVRIDLTSAENVVLGWSGVGAEDGGILLYEVVFDKEGGDFSNPIYTAQSDLGAYPQLTLTHVTLNRIARLAGLKTTQTGKVQWTVRASRGGVVKTATTSATLTLTRPDEEIPEEMYLTGPGTENGGSELLPFRMVSDGYFVIYTQLSAGGILLTDALEEGAEYTLDASGIIVEGSHLFTLDRYTHPVRISVNFNTKQIIVEEISAIRMIWGVNYATIANPEYAGNGIFKAGDVLVTFVQPGDPEWLTWLEERYYFIATVDGQEVCWGRRDHISSERPSDDEPLSFYEMEEFVWDQWEHLWKMHGDLDGKRCTVTIDTNREGMMIHQFSDIR